MSRQTTKANNNDAGSTLKALRRAAQRAREIGVRTGTPVYVIQDNLIIDLTKKNRAVVRRATRQREVR